MKEPLAPSAEARAAEKNRGCFIDEGPQPLIIDGCAGLHIDEPYGTR
jgi:hypothetical protein